MRSVLEGRGKKVEGRDYLASPENCRKQVRLVVFSTLYLLPSTLQNTPLSSFPTLPSEIRRHFPPFLCLPFYYGIVVSVGLQPSFCAGYDLVEMFCLRSAFELGLAFALAHPQHSVIAVGIYCLGGVAHFVEKGQGMYNGKKLPNVVCTV